MEINKIEIAERIDFLTRSAVDCGVFKSIKDIYEHPELNISRQHFGNYRTGKVVPDWETLSILARLLHGSVDWILFGIDLQAEMKKNKHKECVTPDECRLLEIFRLTSEEGGKTIIKVAESIRKEYPIANNVESLPISKRHSRNSNQS